MAAFHMNSTAVSYCTEAQRRYNMESLPHWSFGSWQNTPEASRLYTAVGRRNLCCHCPLAINIHSSMAQPSLVPRPPHPAFVACSTKSGGRPGLIYHVMCAAADVMFSLLTSGFVLSLHSSFPEFSSFFLFSLSCESDCYWIDRG